MTGSAEQSCVGDGVVRRAKRTGGDKTVTAVDQSRNRVDLGCFDCFNFCHRRHDGGEALGEHGLAGSRWADHQNIVIVKTNIGFTVF